LAHRSFSSTPTSSGAEIDAAAGVLSDPAAGQMDVAAGLLSDAATSVVPTFPASFPGEVAAAAADSFAPVAALQYVIDAVHSFTGLNW
jgi:YidC/Oxa1 family membrane protein insertase